MSQRSWWLGVMAIVLAILLHAAVPRYTWQRPETDDPFALIRIDRWTGRAQWGAMQRTGEWQAYGTPGFAPPQRRE